MKRIPRLLLAGLSAVLAIAPAGAEIHPFYEQRLTAGILALSQGEPAVAETELRLAAFGMLDEPARLVVALAHLAAAERASGDLEGLDETLQRLLTIEQRFTVWETADFPPAIRTEVETALGERVPERGLAAVPAFRGLAEEHAARRLAALPPEERRRELTALAAAQPGAARWQVMLGELDLAAGDTTTAAARAQRALAAAPSGRQEVAARCLRGTALARAGSCAAAVADLEACPASRLEPEAARTLLECHVQLAQWRQAKAFADSLPAAISSRRDLRRLVRRVEREVAELATAPAPVVPRPPAASAEAAPPSADSAPPARAAAPPAEEPAATPATGRPARAEAAPPPAGLGPEDRQRLERARRLMTEARKAPELAEPLALAAAVADAHPESVEAQHLAAEIAYRASQWPLAVTYFRRGGAPVGQPELMFYFAVSLWEAGDQVAAARALETALPSLPRNPFIDGYVTRILGSSR